ncbi:ABC transporter substrate-binding protein [Pseudonocardia sp.]|uniref:ABC transporter substrate-binding protein n=1 Tax=Pseudonocardia sp. TaxID=60912 RepID=UPI003D0DF37A
MLRLLLAVLLLVAGCAAGAPGAPPVGSGAFPVTITHALGTTVIPAEPRRIVALSYEEDALALVGVPVVGRAGNLYAAAGEPYPWQRGKVDLAGVDSDAVTSAGDVDFERIAALRPDLILATNRYDLDATYAKLSAIAPTVGYETAWGRSTWQETAIVIGRAVGREDAMTGAIDGVQAYLDGLAAEYPGLAGKTFAGAYHFEPGGFAANTDPEGHSTRLLTGLGMTPDPDFVAGVVDRSLAPENIGLLDADYLRMSFASPDLEQALLVNPLYARLPVVTDGRVFTSDNFGAMASNNPTMLNIPWQLDQQRPVLATVAVR